MKKTASSPALSRTSASQPAEREKKRPALASVAELTAVIAEFNRAHDLDLRDVRAAGQPNEFLDELYQAASSAARRLRRKLRVES